MAKKIIPMKGKKATMDVEVMEKLTISIRNNYALFGDRASEIKMYYIEINNLSSLKDNSFSKDQISASKYLISRDKEGELVYTEDAEDSMYALNVFDFDVTLNNTYTFGEVVNGNQDYPYMDHIGNVMSRYSKCSRTINGSVAIKFMDSSVIFVTTDGDYSETENDGYFEKITYYSGDIESVNIHEVESIKVVVIFPAVKSAPLIRIYRDFEEISDLLAFEDEDCVFNSYFKKYNYTTEERKITNITGKIYPMIYDRKVDDISRYVEGERYIEDPIVYDIQYENKNGFSAEYFERTKSEIQEGSYDIVKKYLYKGVELFQYVTSKDVRTGNITFNERINLASKDIEELKDTESYIKKLSRYINLLSYNICNIELDVNVEAFDMDSLTVLKSKVDDRVVLHVNHNDTLSSVKVELYNGEKYAFITLKYIKSDNSKEIINMLLDDYYLVMMIHKCEFDSHYTLICKRDNKSLQHNNDYFMRTEFKDFNNNDVIKYDGVEGKFALHLNGKRVVKIEAFNSPIYNINDEYIYIRDMYGVPEKIYIK